MGEPTVNQSVELELRQGGLSLVKQLQAVKVVDQQSATLVSERISILKSVIAKWKDYWKEPKAKAKAAHAILCEREGDLLKVLEPAVKASSDDLAYWAMIEREKARKEQEARDKAAWEQRQKEREADEKAKAAVNFEDAAAIIEAAKPTEPLPPAPALPQTGDQTIRDHWKYRVIDLDLVPRPFLCLDDTMVGNYVQEHKGETQIPGIEVYNEPIVAQKRRSQ